MRNSLSGIINQNKFEPVVLAVFIHRTGHLPAAICQHQGVTKIGAIGTHRDPHAATRMPGNGNLILSLPDKTARANSRNCRCRSRLRVIARIRLLIIRRLQQDRHFGLTFWQQRDQRFACLIGIYLNRYAGVSQQGCRVLKLCRHRN